jgi:hypothetical protein
MRATVSQRCSLAKSLKHWAALRIARERAELRPFGKARRLRQPDLKLTVAKFG